jgi:hypothetical protein
MVESSPGGGTAETVMSGFTLERTGADTVQIALSAVVHEAGISTPDAVGISYLCRRHAANAVALMAIPVILALLLVAAPGLSAVKVSPRVLSMEPANGAVELDPTTTVRAIFSESMDPSSLNGFTVTLSDASSQVAGSIHYDRESRTMEFRPYSSLVPNTTYKVKIDASVKGENGMTMDDSAAWIFSTRQVDVIRPLILSASPGSGATDVEDRPEIIVLFSEELNRETVSASSVILSAGDRKIPLSITYDKDNRRIVATPQESLPWGSACVMTMGQAISDLAGNTMARAVEWIFTVRPAPDSQPPKVVRTLPWDGSSRVSLDTSLEIWFDEAIQENDINAFNIHFRDDQDRDIAGMVNYDSRNRVVRFSPAYALRHDTVYTVTVDRAVRDLSGNNLSEDFTFNFTTCSPPDNQAPRIMSVFPADREEGVALNARMQVIFSEDMKDITMNQFTVTLSDGEYKVAGAIAWDGGNKSMTFTPKDKLGFGRTYIFTVRKGIKDLAGNDLVEGVIISFRTIPEPDRIPPRLIFSSPNVGEAGVSVKSRIEVFFDEALDQSSVNLFSISVAEQGGRKVHCKAAYVGEERKVILTPTASLGFDRVYTVRVSGIKDAAGNVMAGQEAWTFRTELAPDEKGPQVVFRNPEDQSQGVDIRTQIKVIFSEGINVLTLNEFTFFITDGVNKVSSSMDYDPASSTAILAPRSNLDYSKVHWVTLKKGICDLAGNKMDQELTWKFVTADPPDLTGPTVVDTVPEEGQSEVDPNANVVVRFSESINDLSVNSDTVTMRASGDDTGIEGKVVYDRSKAAVIFAPVQRLAYNRTYILTITPGVQDLAGNPIDRPFRVSFTTISRQRIAGMDLEKGFTYFETNPFPDITSDHWAYNGVRDLARKGYLKGTAATLFKGDGKASRYEMALILKSVIDNVNTRRKLDKYDALLLEKLVTEFSTELNVVGARVDDFSKTLKFLGIQVKDARIEVARLRDRIDGLKEKAALEKQIEKYRRMAAMALIMMM